VLKALADMMLVILTQPFRITDSFFHWMAVLCNKGLPFFQMHLIDPDLRGGEIVRDQGAEMGRFRYM